MVEIKAPLLVGIQITGRCNLKCKYCYAENLVSRDIPKERISDIFQQLAQIEVFQVIIEGGEPFLHPYFIDVMRCGLRYCPDLAVLSNGTIVNENACRELSNLKSRYPDMGVQISLDSHIPEVNDISRGKGREVLKNIELLLSYGIDITIATVIHKGNIAVADKLIDYFYPKIKLYHFMNIMPTRWNLSNWDSLRCEERQIESFWQALQKRNFPSDISISHPCDNINVSMGKSTICANNCLAGIIRVYITPELDVIACNIADFSVMGNLNEKSFQEIWFSEAAEKIRREKFPQCWKILEQAKTSPVFQDDLNEAGKL